MEKASSGVLVLEEGQDLPPQTQTPPRQPHWYDTFSYIANPDKFCRQNLEKYGSVFKTGVFGGTTVFVGDSQAIKMVFNGDSEYTEIALPPTTMDMFGEYSLFQRPDLHRQRKSALKPAFTGSLLEGYIPRISNTIREGLQRWNISGDSHSNSQSISQIISTKIALYPEVEKISFDVLTPLLWGLELDDNNPESFAGLPIESKAQVKALYKTYFNGFYGLVQWKSPLTAYGRGIQARGKLIELVREVIKRKKATPIDPTSDFLSMMLASQEENPESVFDNNLIENQGLLQLWASHYEISGLISSLIYKLGQYRQLVSELRQEQEQLHGKIEEKDRFSLDNLKQMTLLDATIKEVMRTLAPSSTANRRLTKSVIVNGVVYQKGWVAIAEPRLAHIMSEHFSEPDKFDPERFLPPRNEGKMYQFIPFGGGVHGCLGAQMAMVVTKIFAIHLLSRFDWESVGEASFIQFPLKKIKDNYQVNFQVNYRVNYPVNHQVKN